MEVEVFIASPGESQDNETKESASVDDFLQEMEKKVEKFVNLFEKPKVLVRVLLHRINWDEIKLGEFFEEYFKSFEEDEKSPITCETCREVGPVLSLFCTHKICVECFKDQIAMQMEISLSFECIKCFFCGFPIEDELVLSHIPHIIDQLKFKKLVISSFIAKKAIFFCPKSDCRFVVSNKKGKISCRCGYRYCAMTGVEELLSVEENSGKVDDSGKEENMNNDKLLSDNASLKAFKQCSGCVLKPEKALLINDVSKREFYQKHQSIHFKAKKTRRNWRCTIS
jgi:hypothetical protein